MQLELETNRLRSQEEVLHRERKAQRNLLDLQYELARQGSYNQRIGSGSDYGYDRQRRYSHAGIRNNGASPFTNYTFATYDQQLRRREAQISQQEMQLAREHEIFRVSSFLCTIVSQLTFFSVVIRFKRY